MHAHAKESKIFSTLSLGAKISKYIFFIKKAYVIMSSISVQRIKSYFY